MSSISSTSLRSRPLPNRLLFPTLPPDAQLPHLVHSLELTTEFYDLIALALRAFVVPWWSKISRYDKHFLPEITRILATVIRELDTRIQAAPLAPLFLSHVPSIITQHYRDYRNAHHKLGTSYASGASASLPQLFHQLQPHLAVSADGQLDAEYFRLLVDHVLKVCLPPEDYQPDSERFIVREIILKVLLNDVIPKITQPWFIHKSMLDLLQIQDQSPHPPRSPPPAHFSFHSVLVFFLSTIQIVSGVCLALIHAYRKALTTLKHVNQIRPPSLPSSHLPHNHTNYIHASLAMISEIFALQDRIASTILLITTRLLADLSVSFLDRLLPYLVINFLSTTFVLSTTRTAKRVIFPNGYPGPPPPEPSPEEQAETLARLVAWRPSSALATRLLPLLLGPFPSKTLQFALDPLSSAPCNVHLVLFLLDCVMVTLFPELAVAEDRETDMGK